MIFVQIYKGFIVDVLERLGLITFNNWNIERYFVSHWEILYLLSSIGGCMGLIFLIVLPMGNTEF